MKKQLLFAFIFCISILGYTQTFTNNFFTYQVLSPVSPYTVTITDYDFTGGINVNIPSSVIYNSNTYNVVRIGNYAFQGNTTTGEQLTSVIIPNTVTYIGLGAFSFNQLASVIIPNSVTTIDNIAFTNNQLTSVTLSNNLVSIPLGIFQGNLLTSVTIPNSVTSIQGNAFLIINLLLSLYLVM
ncbi:MAG: leucine-rich repeat domain-containing protein [Flavobacterium sp.]|nr:leucine-rich repeat domain-containing protein [Flavobacterium sp.]